MKHDQLGLTATAGHNEAPDDSAEPVIEQVVHNTTRKLLSLLGAGTIILILIHTTSFGEQIRNWDTLSDLVKAGGFKAYAYFVLISTFLIMLGTPRLLFYALGGFAFGFWEGLLWSLCSSLLGSFLAFRAARWGGKEWLTERFGRRRFFGRIAHAQPTIASVALMRMLPVSNAIINAGLALSEVGNSAFLLGSLVGFLPQGVIAVIIGTGMADDIPWAGPLQLVIVGILLVLTFFLSARNRKKQG